MINKVLWFLFGFVVILLMFAWLDRQVEKRITAAYEAGIAQCDAGHNQKTLQINSEITAKTQEILRYKNLLKEQRKELSDDCKAIYDIDLSSCRQQLRDKTGS